MDLKNEDANGSLGIILDDPLSSNKLPPAALKEEDIISGGEDSRTAEALLPVFLFSLQAICNTLAASRRLT